MNNLKAYKVRCRDDDHGCAVHFTETAQAARQRGNNDMCDCPYIELRATRDPELDRYAPGPVSDLILFRDHGWCMVCQQCESHIHADDAAYVVADDNFFCTAECQRKHAEYWAARAKAPDEPYRTQDGDTDDDLPRPGKTWDVLVSPAPGGPR